MMKITCAICVLLAMPSTIAQSSPHGETGDASGNYGEIVNIADGGDPDAMSGIDLSIGITTYYNDGASYAGAPREQGRDNARAGR